MLSSRASLYRLLAGSAFLFLNRRREFRIGRSDAGALEGFVMTTDLPLETLMDIEGLAKKLRQRPAPE